jgi:predicted RNA-binding protein
MCEFKVFNRGQLVAKDIVYANMSNGVLTLKDVLHSPINAGEALIAEIDVVNETLRLREDPLIGDMLRFLEAVASCEQSAKYDSGLEEIWQKVKCRGDERVRELWRRHGKPLMGEATR